MPSISKIRLTNIVYEEGNKRYNDELFLFDGHNGAILLENGGGKTVFIQTALQAILPHTDLANRKIKTTLMLENAPAHIAIEWITNDQPRRYAVTAVSLFTTKQGLDSLRYVYEYDANDPNGIEGIPFVRDGREGKRTADRGEMQDYYSHMRDKTFSARTFHTIKEYKTFLEEQYHIISGEWESIAKINSSEGGVEAFFDECKSTNQLFDRLLIPTVESSIVGHESTLFADMFEQQHASFKNYKKLKETIEENKQIEHHLEKYAGTFEKLHQREIEYLKTKQHAKGTWNKILNEKQQFSKEHALVIEKLEEWKRNQELYQVKTSSYEIFSEELVLQRLETEYKEALARATEKEESLQQHRKDYYSLKLAALKLDRKEQADALHQIEEEIAKYEQTLEVQEYEDQLIEAKQALLGWYLSQIERIEKDKQSQIYQLNPLLNQLQQTKESIEKLRKKETNLRELLSKHSGIIHSREHDVERLKQLLLSNPEQEEVQVELIHWQERAQFLDEDIIRLKQEVKQLMMQIQEADERKENLQKDYNLAKTDKNTIEYELSTMKKAQENLMERLTALRPQWIKMESIYHSQNSIESFMLETIDLLMRQKDALLHKERVAYRFVDDYGNQNTFFSDAFLETQLSSWKNQVDYLVTGVEYLEGLDGNVKERIKIYPLWPITLVTTNKSKPKVIEKLNHLADQLQFPITVITTEEALSIHQQENNHSWIAPDHWNKNIDANFFQEWKKQIGTYAKECSQQRIEKEGEIKRWEDGLNAFNHFLHTFPYEQITQLNEKLSKLKNQLEEYSASIQNQKQQIDEQRLKMSQHQRSIEQHHEEKQGLEGKIEKGIQYLQFEKEIEEERKKEKEAKEQLFELTRFQMKVNQELPYLEDEVSQFQARIADLNAELRILAQDEDYQSLKAFTPSFTNESKKNIQDQIRSLEMKISEINVTQGEWLAKQEATRKTIQRLDTQMKELLNEHREIDEERDFPSDGKSFMQTLWNRITQMDKEVEILTSDLQRKMSRMDKQKGKWETKNEQFKEDFPAQDILMFNQPLVEIRDQLNAEKEALDERKAFIDQELARMEKELKWIEEAKYGLELFEEGHHFTAPDIQAISLSTEESIHFSYNRKKFVKAITDELKKNQELVELESKEVEHAKRQFREFCLNHISDIKLQQMAINGVEHKQDYEEIIDFKKNMIIRIEKSSRYANEHIRQSDEDVQHFINSIHSHLLTLVEELKQIPKKTKVKVLDDWKQIFSFTIPEWGEEIGKMRIREYIEWILQQLESEQFLNEQGIQDDGKVRKEIEMWLQSKQLLQMVMNNEVMKVSCRKVTNDNKVTTRSYSWEQSNIWSGGEKWSKNMTLFLGILNYVAEKKKHIQANMKHHRAVILDNPFGKASSEHVLSPVFFVAEQLGFQIIALTAHAEGKFLQDYFPVIYSCRLRASTDANKKVMTKEKWLHHAYFEDHEPKAMERLGETEQMVLFE